MWWWEKCKDAPPPLPLPLPPAEGGAALWKEGSAPHLGSTVECTLLTDGKEHGCAWEIWPHPLCAIWWPERRAGPEVMRASELPLPFTNCRTQESGPPKPHLGNTVVLTLLAGTQVSHTQSCECGRAGPTTQQSCGRVCVCVGEIDASPISCPSLAIADKRADCPSYQLWHSGPLGSDLERQSLLLAVFVSSTFQL